MLYSMTGFGRTEEAIGERTFLVEVKSLNGKQFDLRLQIPALLKPFEFEIRNLLNENLERGSVECIINIKQNGAAKPVIINNELLKAYYQSVMTVADELNADTNQLLSAILRLPEVVVNSTDVLPDEEWNMFKTIFLNALQQINNHRKKEGDVLEADLLQRIHNIEELQKHIATLEPLRRQKIKDGLQKVLEDNLGKENYDPNRLEQELIYYIEKIDISEEQVRLSNHLDYFKSLLPGKDKSKGKKLSFILQEIGREINTTGSKAYDSEIQKSVVLMKDELEKAKEQVLNVL
jgi:uncharacterized protein (TIGR00255 family)